MRRLLATVAAAGLFAAGCTAARRPDAHRPAASLGTPGALSRAVHSPSPPDCGAIDIGSREYGSHLSADQGEPGDTVVAYGPTLRGEDWRYSPGTRIEVWWNSFTPTASATPLDRGPVILLGTVPILGKCAFQLSFEVPRVAPGTYRIVAFIFFFGGSGLFGCHDFAVGIAPPPPTPRDNDLPDCAGIR